MKINRLLEIIIILLNRGTVTAKELAQRFGVSTRTIYRDIDVLSISGVPVYSSKGTGGGISLLENYALNKTMLSTSESESILFALKTLQATKYPEIDTILEKLGAVFKTNATDWIHIDFSPWGSDPNQNDKITDIKKAVLSANVIEFDYISANNTKSHRLLEPLRLVFKGQAWYIWGWSTQREDFRTFRISRMRGVKVLGEKFDRHKTRIPIKRENNDPEYEIRKKPVELCIKFHEAVLSRIYDDYSDNMITNNGDGTYTVNATFNDDEWIFGYILSFGDNAEVLGPPDIRERINEKIKNMLMKYE